MFKFILPFLVAVLMFACKGTQDDPGTTSLSATAFSQKIQQSTDAQIVDVRTPEEFAKSHLPNSVNYNYQAPDFLDQVASLDKSKPVFAYCLSGSRSAEAAEAMRKNGFTEVYEMDGGLLQWRTSGLPETVDNDPNSKNAEGGINQAAFAALLDTDKLVLIDFYADWCGPCKMMEPGLANISKDLQDKVTIVRINVDENPDLSMEMNITSIPNFKLYKDKELIWQHVGFIEEEALRKKLN